MKLCPICKRDVTEEKKYLFLGKDDDFWLICESCERKLYLVTNGRRKRWVYLAIADLYEKTQGSQDVRLKAYLWELIENRRRNVGMHIPYL